MSSQPLFNWLNYRSAGLLCHPVSFPSSTGIGNFGPEAYRFIDFLSDCGFRAWQLCPLGPTGYGDSPYQCFSAFAGNPYLIDPDALCDLDLCSPAELLPLRKLSRQQADYGSLYNLLMPLLLKIGERFVASRGTIEGFMSFEDFKSSNAFWLDGYAAFTAAKAHHGGICWLDWPLEARSFGKFSKSALARKLAPAIEVVKALQYIFSAQWSKLRAYASSKGIEVIGDAPIFVAMDSADVWEAPERFSIDLETCKPTVVAGVPPDYFCESGQLWGNPLYNWEVLAEDGYQWWISRLKANFSMFDIVRIDHFIGFQNYYAIPADAPDARVGTWKKGPGLAFFKAVQKALPQAKLIAEDLGVLTDEVVQLRDQSGLPGMTVMQFGFGGDAGNGYLPHNHIPNQVVYPGTHDNDTTVGWYRSSPANVTDHFRRYLETDGRSPGWDLFRAAMRSPARLAVTPLQDLMELGSEARMNQPGQSLGNWQWRFTRDQLERVWQYSGSYLRQLNQIYGRCR